MRIALLTLTLQKSTDFPRLQFVYDYINEVGNKISFLTSF